MTDKRPNETWEDLAERRIREAHEAGEFNNLPGFGLPIPGIDDVLEDDWWLKAKLRREELTVLPPIMEARLAREKFLENLSNCPTEATVRKQLQSVNELIRKAHYSPVAGPSGGVLPLAEDQVLAQWRSIRQ